MVKLKGMIDEWGTRGIAFDLDGTLTHTLDQHIEAFQVVFERHGHEVDREEIASHMGRRPEDITRDIIFKGRDDADLSPGELESLWLMAREKAATFKSLIPEHPPLMPGLPAVLERCKALCLRLAVCSSTPRENVKIILSRIGLLEYFDVLVTAEDVRMGKPHPEAFMTAARELGLDPSEVVVVGDSVHDVESARAGKMRVLAVATGKHGIAALQASSPDVTVATLEELR